MGRSRSLGHCIRVPPSEDLAALNLHLVDQTPQLKVCSDGHCPSIVCINKYCKGHLHHPPRQDNATRRLYLHHRQTIDFPYGTSYGLSAIRIDYNHDADWYRECWKGFKYPRESHTVIGD